MVDALSSVSRIHTTHKTYKNKLYSNTNISGLWEKISESFSVENDRYSSAPVEVDKTQEEICNILHENNVKKKKNK